MVPIRNQTKFLFPHWIVIFTNDSAGLMGIFHTNILMGDNNETVTERYVKILFSYYHMKLICDQNHKNILNLAGGFHL